MVKPENLTDDELLAAIDQLGAEVSMGHQHQFDALKAHQDEADERGLMY